MKVREWGDRFHNGFGLTAPKHTKNRPLSALISNLGGCFKITARFAGQITFLAEPI